MAIIRLNVEADCGEITVSRDWKGETHTQITDESPISREVLFDYLFKIEAELEGKK